MRNYITFNNTDLRNYGVYISGTGVFNSPVRKYNALQIPGKNGDILGSERRLENIEVTYPAFVYTSFNSQIAALRAFLLSQTGYKKLTDTYNTDEYRLAYYEGGLEVEPTQRLDAGQFDLTFVCKPQRFLTSGDTVTTLTADGTITNPTLFESQPLLRVYGTGAVTVNGVTITITEADSYTDIDCEIMEAYKGTTSCNNFIQLSEIDFPVLSPGSNSIDLNGVSQVQITPRWWTV